jgi:hypothetical protein
MRLLYSSTFWGCAPVHFPALISAHPYSLTYRSMISSRPHLTLIEPPRILV